LRRARKEHLGSFDAAGKAEQATPGSRRKGMLHVVRRALTRVGEFTTHPGAFAAVVAYALAWLVLSPDTFGWGAIATLATWLIRCSSMEPRSDLTLLDHRDVEDIEEHRRRHKQDAEAKTIDSSA
jgi:hypothetical protein